MEDLDRLLEKIKATIQLDVNNMYLAAGNKVLPPEYQDALVKYLKLLTDVKLAQKERELEEKIKRAEEIISGGASS